MNLRSWNVCPRPLLRLAAAAGAALLVNSCAATGIQAERSPKAQKQLAEALSGRTAGAPIDCLPSFKADNMQVVDDYTILFRDGGTVYVQNPPGGCRGIGLGGYTLVTHRFGTTQMCRGDINRLVDLRTGMTGGSCVFGPFVPYRKAA